MSKPIHLTDIGTYFTCPRKYKYSQKDRIKPKPLVTNNEPVVLTSATDEVYFDYGTAGHSVLQDWFTTNESVQDLVAKYYSNFDDILYNQALLLLEHYTDVYKEDKNNWEIIIAETPFVWEFEGHSFESKLDKLVRNKKTKSVWVWDYKFYSKKQSIYMLEFSDQFMGYAYSVKKYFGVDISGIVADCIIKSDIQFPPLLQSGKLSKDKSLSTTPKLYRKAIDLFGLNEQDYSAYLNYLENERTDPFLDRHYFLKDNNDFEVWETNFRKKLNEVGRVDYPIIGMSCNKCAYKRLCHASLKGSATGILEQYYVKKGDDER